MKSKLIFILLTTVMLQITTSCEFKYKEFSKEEEKVLFPKQIGLLNDFENILTKKQQEELEIILLDFKKNENRNIVITSVKSFSPYEDFQKFTIDLGNSWNIEQNSILIVVSKEKRKIGLSIVKGVKGLTDEESQQVVSDIMIPKFTEDKYYDGIKSGVDGFISKWNY